jgi:hypothetical protein
MDIDRVLRGMIKSGIINTWQKYLNRRRIFNGQEGKESSAEAGI